MYLRVYSRDESKKAISKWQYSLPEATISNFYIFPNVYINTLVYRDE
jgi:hypothetical protein